MDHSSSSLAYMIDAYLDGELTPAERRDFEQRLVRDVDLQAQVAAEQQFRQQFRSRVRQTVAPASLRAEVQAMLARSEAPAAVPSASLPQILRHWLTAAFAAPRWAALAAAMVLFVLGAGFSALFVSPSTPTKTTHTAFRRLAGKHAVYFSDVPVLDVQGDPNQVAAWLQSRAPWPVAVPQLTGWSLAGGRLGEFHHEPAIFLLYQRDGQRLSLVQFSPRESDFPPEARQRLPGRDVYVDKAMGYPVVLWQQNGVGYGLIGDKSQTVEQLLTLGQEIFPQISEN